MDLGEAVKQELARISATLSKALRDSTPEEWRSIVEKAIHQIDHVVERIDKPKAEPPRAPERTAERTEHVEQ